MTCFFLRVRCQMRQHIFSSLELRSRVLRVATTLIHVRCRSDSSTPVTTSSTKYLVGLKCPVSLRFTAVRFWSSFPGAPLSSMASRYPLIHSLPAIFSHFLTYFPAKHNLGLFYIETIYRSIIYPTCKKLPWFSLLFQVIFQTNKLGFFSLLFLQ